MLCVFFRFLFFFDGQGELFAQDWTQWSIRYETQVQIWCDWIFCVSWSVSCFQTDQTQSPSHPSPKKRSPDRVATNIMRSKARGWTGMVMDVKPWRISSMWMCIEGFLMWCFTMCYNWCYIQTYEYVCIRTSFILMFCLHARYCDMFLRIHSFTTTHYYSLHQHSCWCYSTRSKGRGHQFCYEQWRSHHEGPWKVGQFLWDEKTWNWEVGFV